MSQDPTAADVAAPAADVLQAADVAAAEAPKMMAPPVPAYTTAGGAVSPYPLFYDSCSKQYPASAQRIVVYRDDGDGPAECVGFPPDRHKYEARSITRQGGADAAAYASILDYEWSLQAYEHRGQAREFADTRAAHGERFINYCPRALLGELLRELGPALWNMPHHRLWIPTLDGHQWGPTELADNIRIGWGIVVNPSRIWGNQWAESGPRGTGELLWDESSLYPDHRF